MISDAAAFHRFGLGPRPGDLDVGDVRAALRDEIGDRAAARLDSPGLLDAGGALSAMIAIRQAQAAARNGANNMLLMVEPQDRVTAETINRDEIAARVARVLGARIGFVDRLVAFWNNHFAVEASSGMDERALVGAFEREAIRPYVLGSFRDLLGAATKHPAMLGYLDNALSVGPNSPAGLAANRGLNENHARELLELHTVGVDAGYTQADVTALARILTGWTFVARDAPSGPPVGSFIFRAQAHEPGVQTVLGIAYPDDGVGQGEAVLDFLAAHPATANHIARKLARHFVADEPAPELVDRLANTFAASGGDLQAVAVALIDSDEAFADERRLKPPQEFLWSAIRALGITPAPRQVVAILTSLGQPLFNPPSPEGFDDDGATWLAPDAMTTRLDVAEQMALAASPALRPGELAEAVLGDELQSGSLVALLAAESEVQALTMLLMLPEFQRR
ncbi:MAG: DUF1800 domain-containing protein [Bauldia sp.]|nr:DUF1800 domain-containing protein [Bauldia sp.]